MTHALLFLAASALAQAGEAARPAYTSKVGGFSIALPAAPTESFRQEDSPAGPVLNKVYQVTQADGIHTVIVTDYPGQLKPGGEGALLDGVLRGYTQTPGASLLEKKTIRIEGLPAGEVALQMPQGILHARYFVKGMRIYQIVQLQVGQDDPAKFDRFAKTFRTVAPVGKLSDGVEALSTWKEFASKEGGFRVKMIGEPKEQLQKLVTPNGPVELHLFLGNNLKGENFGVSYSEVPKAVPAPTPAEFYDTAVAGAVANLKGKLNRRKAIEYDGHPGAEAEVGLPGKVPFPDGVFLVRMYWIEDRMYQVIYVGPRANAQSPEVVSFLDSFRLEKGKP